MTAMLIRRLAWLLVACALFLHAIERFNPHPPQLLVQADYQRCVTIRNEPLVVSKPQIAGTSTISEVS
jgi:hypothetical protein